MTAFSFILGVVPLVIASGAGAASRRSLGTAVFGGMLAATVLGVFFVPLLYVIVQSTTDWVAGTKTATSNASASPEDTPREESSGDDESSE